MMRPFGLDLVSSMPEVTASAEKMSSRAWPEVTGKVHGRAPLDGRPIVMLGSNDYLGLASHPAVIAGARAALEEYGAGTGMNPVLGVTRVHHQLMEAMREFTGCEDVLLFNSCTAANCALIASLVGPQDVVISDELNHASIIDGCRLARGSTLVYKHTDMGSLDDVLLSAAHARVRLVVSDGVFSMEGDVVPLPEIARVSAKHRAVIAIDESHAAGVIGPTGRGTADLFRMTGPPPIQTGTFSKAFGSGIGGYVGGPKELIQHLRDRARFFIFTSGMPAVAAGAALAALDVLRSEPERLARLRQNTATFRAGLKNLGLELLPNHGPITPIMVGASEQARRLNAALLELGVYVPAMSYPIVPEGAARLRAQVSAAHSDGDLAVALSAFARAFDEIQ